MTEVRLRAVDAADLPALYEHQADPVGAAMAGVDSRDPEAFAAHHARIAANPGSIVAAIVAHGEVVGSIGSWPDGERRFVGYWIGRSHWGRGIATAALAEFVEGWVSARPLHAWVVPDNVGSRRVLERCGFVLAETHEDELLYELAGRASSD